VRRKAVRRNVTVTGNGTWKWTKHQTLHSSPTTQSAAIAHASQQRLKIAQHDWLDSARLPPDCFFYAVIRLKRARALELQMLFVVLEPQGDMDEADCMAAWDAAADTLVGAHVERMKQ
jgi:hypothetical protein